MEGRTAQTEVGNGSDSAEMGMGRPQFHMSVDCALRAGLSLFVFFVKCLLSFLPTGGDNKNRKD